MRTSLTPGFPRTLLPRTLRAGCLAFYPLHTDDDDSKAALDLTPTGTPTFPADYADLDDGDYLTRAHPDLEFNALSDWTAAGWFFFDGIGLQTLFGTENRWHLMAFTDSLQLRLYNGTGFQNAIKSFTPAAGVWFYVRAWYVHATRTGYLDVNESGTPASTVLSADNVQSGAPAFRIGQNVSGFGNLVGRTRLVGLWNRAFSATNAQKSFNGGIGRDPFDGSAALPVTSPPDQIAATATADYIRIASKLTSPGEVKMIWVDGELAPPDDFGGVNEHIWYNSGNTNVITLRRSLFPTNSGALPVNLVHVTGSALGTYVTGDATIPGTPFLPVMPTVVSAQAIRTDTITRCMFHSAPKYVIADDVAEDFHDAGINALAMSIFTNPADNGATTLAQWQAAMDNTNLGGSHIQPGFDFAEANGFYIYGVGDDFFRNLDQRAWTKTGSFREAAIRETAQRLIDTGLCVGVDMLDEVGGEPDDIGIDEFVGWWRDQGGPPLAWPAPGVYALPHAWEVPEASDFSSRFWTDTEYRQGRSDGMTGWQYRKAFERAAVGVPSGWIWMAQVSITGPFYYKDVAGSDYQAGLDELIKNGNRAETIPAQMWLALAYGASGFRMYGYDWSLWRDQRANELPGSTQDLQTGSRPGDERWAGVVAGCLSIENREAGLMGTVYTPVVSGPWVCGRRGSIWWAINTSEQTLIVPTSGTIVTQTGETTGSSVPPCGVIIFAV